MPSAKNTIILYHADCPDGFGAAYAAWKKLGNKAEYIPVEYSNPPPKMLKNKDIYMVDFSYAKNVLKQIVKTNKSVTVIDHHVSRREDIKVASQWFYALDHSGATLTWQFFHPNKKIPKLLKHIEDVDLWRLKLPHTDAVLSIVSVTKWTFKDWDKLAHDLENKRKFKELLKNAQWIMKAESRLKERVMKNADMVKFQGYKTYAVNSPIFNSEIGHNFCKKLPPIGIVWKVKQGKIFVSLRSDGTVDVSKLAKKFPNGGGHKAAAAFNIPASEKLPWKLLNEKIVNRK